MSEDTAAEVALLEAIENAALRSQRDGASPETVATFGRAAHDFADALAIVRQGRAPFAPKTTGQIYP